MTILKAIAGAEFHLVPLPQALNCLRHFSCHWTHQVFENICPKLCKYLSKPKPLCLDPTPHRADQASDASSKFLQVSWNWKLGSWSSGSLQPSELSVFLWTWLKPSEAPVQRCPAFLHFGEQSSFAGSIVSCLCFSKKTMENGKIQGNPDLFGNGSRLSFQAKQCLPISSLRWGQGQNRCPAVHGGSVIEIIIIIIIITIIIMMLWSTEGRRTSRRRAAYTLHVGRQQTIYLIYLDIHGCGRRHERYRLC